MHNVVVAGVSGAGKSTVGLALAQRLEVDFGDADSFHSASNIAKMTAGTPLNDADRASWIEALANWIKDHVVRRQAFVLACSALKLSYRDAFRQADPDIYFAYLIINESESKERIKRRPEQFFPVSLVHSQFQTVEPLQGFENGHDYDARAPISEVVTSIIKAVY